jgi:hypothetical protein
MWLKSAGPNVPEGGPGPENVACIFYFLCSIITRLLYKLTLSDQTQVTQQLKVSLSEFFGRGEEVVARFLFSPDPKPTVGGSVRMLRTSSYPTQIPRC